MHCVPRKSHATYDHKSIIDERARFQGCQVGVKKRLVDIRRSRSLADL